MSAQDNLGGQWQRVYRGMPHHPDKINLGKTGTHWTPDIEAAKTFTEAAPWEDARKHGTVIEGLVHSSDVVKPHTEEWYNMGGVRPGSEEEQHAESGMGFNSHSIYDPEHHEEKEVTVRPGAMVHVTRMHHFVDGVSKARKVEKTGGA